MKVLITGGGGFIGSHAAEFYAKQGAEVVIFDNLSRPNLAWGRETNDFNCRYLLSHYCNVSWVREEILNQESLRLNLKGSDLVIHAAAQTAVTTSYDHPLNDLLINTQGTLTMLEAVRREARPPAVIFCSTNKVYGSRPNQIQIRETAMRYEFADPSFQYGIDEKFGVDLCAHTPYGCSKLAADLYLQDYAARYGLKIGIFRQSCIYGPRQFGIEDQGWLAWFAISTLSEKPIRIYGDGKQVRDVLYVDDLIEAFDLFFQKVDGHQVFNIGGGSDNTASLLETLDLLGELTGKRSLIHYRDWRPQD